MSGLLVKSTLIMRDNLEELNERNLSRIPVLLGGAALTRSYVERDLREVYEGRLFYGKDAFEGLRVMDRLGEIKRGADEDADWGRVPSESRVPARTGSSDTGDDPHEPRPARSPEVDTDNVVPTPPFLGTKVVKGIALDDIAAYINETALFRNQWQFRPETGADGSAETDEEFKARIRPILRQQLAEAKAVGHARPPAGVRLLRSQRRRRRPRDLDRREPHDRAGPLPLPAPERSAVPVHRRLLPPDRLRARPTTPPSTSSRWANG